MTKQQKDFLLKEIKGKILFDEPLSKHISLKVGGPADVYIELADLSSLIKIAKFSADNQIPFFIIGKGSNLLVKDKGVRGIVVRLNSPDFVYVRKENECLRCGGGTSLGKVLTVAKENSLSGLEFTIGIPASVGGALKTNLCVAYPTKKEIKDFINEVEIFDFRKGEKKYLLENNLNYFYRNSNFNNDYVILGVKFNLEKSNRNAIEKKIDDFVSYRQKTQELSFPSAGCIFKNPPGQKTAAWLIEQCGLKGIKVGGAEVSSRHSNFIINRQKKATSENILDLVKIIQTKIKEIYNIDLELEVDIWG